MVEALKADPFGWYRANKLNAARMAGARVEAEQQKQAEEDPLWHHEMLRKHMASMGRMHFDMLWVHFLNVLLGAWLATSPFVFGRSEERRVGKECVSTCRSRWAP